MKLYSYCLRIDDGCAPNPYYGICTLAICKPAIRRTAQVGDWVVGIGSKNFKGKSYEGMLVYAMKVTQKMTMQEYDSYCKNNLPKKIPDILNKKYERCVGDSIYDFDIHPDGHLLPSVHKQINKKTDLSGKNVLLSNHFYYFGTKAITVPDHLKGIIIQGRSHKVHLNDHLKEEFVMWIESQGYTLNKLYGKPQFIIPFKYSKLNKVC